MTHWHKKICDCLQCQTRRDAEALLARREVEVLLREAERPEEPLTDGLLSLAAMTERQAEANQAIEDLACTLLNQRRRIAGILERFYSAELSMSSVDPILSLALELNPHLRKER